MTVTNGPGPGDDNGNGDGEPGQVTVRLINNSSRAVDVQLYAAEQAVSDIDAEFFVSANQIVSGIGFAGSGLLEPGQSDEVILPCAQAAMVGTRGGRFLDQNTGEELGTGTRYAIFLDSQFQCGGTVIFIYTRTGAVFQTGLSIIPPG